MTNQISNIDLLTNYPKSYTPTQDEINNMISKIKEILESFGVVLEGGEAFVGSNVTQYEFTPSIGTKLNKIKGLEEDIALHLGAVGVRIIAPVRGKAVVAIEVPNSQPNVVGLKDVMKSDSFSTNSEEMELPIALGENTVGQPFFFDLTKAPHVLIGGATGQGKSVGINVMLNSLILNADPKLLKFMMVDVKKVELDIYNKISNQFKPDFLSKMVFTETNEIIINLGNVVAEMDNRYELLKDAQCRTIKEYNNKVINNELEVMNGHQFLPYVVVVIDEFADLMMTAGKDVEYPITRLAQLARAIGIHLIVATQRPSATVITGNIKANFPTRIAFRVTSNMDSRTILDSRGAEHLIGNGDMLFYKGVDLERVQSAFIQIDEIDRITDYLQKQKTY